MWLSPLVVSFDTYFVCARNYWTLLVCIVTLARVRMPTPSRRRRSVSKQKTTPIRTPRDTAPRARAPTDAPRRPGRRAPRTRATARPRETGGPHRSRPPATPARRHHHHTAATLKQSKRRRAPPAAAPRRPILHLSKQTPADATLMLANPARSTRSPKNKLRRARPAPARPSRGGGASFAEAPSAPQYPAATERRTARPHVGRTSSATTVSEPSAGSPTFESFLALSTRTRRAVSGNE